MKKHIKKIIVLIVGLVLGFLLIKYPSPHDRILNIQNYLITVGGIISAFVISYLAAKIFNIRNERENRQVEINKYSVRLTDFRRLLYFVMSSREFWTQYADIAAFRKKYPTLTYEKLHAQTLDTEATAAWNDTTLSCNTIDLYCAMMAIYGDPDFKTGSMWALDKAASFNYTVEDLVKFYDPSNQIWYYLDGRFAKHGHGRFTDDGMNPLWKPYVQNLLPKIDSKFKGKDFHRLVLAEISSEFYELIIPTLIGLIKRNTGIPKSLLRTFYSLFSIMAFGVVFPIIVQSLKIPDTLDTALTLSCVWLTILSLLIFTFDFYTFLEEDVHIK